MRDLTVSYDTKEAGIKGSFVRRNFFEPADWAEQLGNITLAENPLFLSLYWGWFRQVVVTWRGEAKRLRVGNKSNAPLSEAEVAERMANARLPVYSEQSEGTDKVEKVSKLVAAMTPDEIARLHAALGITEHSSRG